MSYPYSQMIMADRTRRTAAILSRPRQPRVDLMTADVADLEGLDFSPILLDDGEAPALSRHGSVNAYGETIVESLRPLPSEPRPASVAVRSAPAALPPPAVTPTPQPQAPPTAPQLRVLPGGRAGLAAPSQAARLRELRALIDACLVARDRYDDASRAALEALAEARADGVLDPAQIDRLLAKLR